MCKESRNFLITELLERGTRPCRSPQGRLMLIILIILALSQAALTSLTEELCPFPTVPQTNVRLVFTLMPIAVLSLPSESKMKKRSRALCLWSFLKTFPLTHILKYCTLILSFLCSCILVVFPFNQYHIYN